jgi:hypothetical protein
MSTTELTTTETTPPANPAEPALDESGTAAEERWQVEERRRDAYRVG